MRKASSLAPRDPWLACSGFVAFCALAFFWRMLFLGQVPVLRDILHTTLPLGEYVGARLRAGELPQWFPFEDLGAPFIGQLNESTFHPATWLYVVFRGVSALRLEIVLAYLAAAFGQLLLARRLGMGAPAAAVAAVVFAFSGYAISLSNLVPYLWGLATLPWLGLCAAQVLTRPRPWPWVALLALVWATIVFAGDSHSALFGGLVVLVVAGILGAWRRLPLCVGAALVALGVAGVELVPAIDIVALGPRAAWHGTRLLGTYWALHPYRLPELLLPNWIPSAVGYLVFSLDRYRENGLWALTIHAGVPAVALAVVGLLHGGRRGRWAGLVALLGLWLALGAHGGLEPAIRRAVPLLSALRFPEKHLAIWTFGLSLAAAAGLEALRERHGRTLAWAMLGGAAACALAAALIPPGVAHDLWPRITSPETVRVLHASFRASLVAACVSMLLVGALLLALRLPRAVSILPLAIFVELWSANARHLGLAPVATLEETPRFCAAARAAGAGPAGVRSLGVPSSNPMAVGDGPGWVSLSRNFLQPAESSLCGIESLAQFWTLSNEPRAVRKIFGSAQMELNPALPLYGVGLVVRSDPAQHVPDETILDRIDSPTGAYALVRRPAAPRAYAAVPRWVPDASAAAAAVAREGRALQRSPVLVGSGAPFEGEGAAGAVRIVGYRPEHVALEVEMDRAGAVILNDLDSNGWTARVDGTAARIYNANALVRGVLVPRGSHRIEMRYALPGLPRGLALTGASLAACLALLLSGVRRRAPAPSAGASADAAEHALQRAYWAQADAAHFEWQTNNAYIAASERELLAGIVANSGERLLEIGCGEGANLRNLGANLQGAQIVAVDFSQPKARFVAGIGGAARGICADAASLPFGDAVFEAVLIRDLLHHVPDRTAVLAEAVRVLKPGGRLTLIEPNGKNPIIAAMALAIRAERGMLASGGSRALVEARGAGLVDARVEVRQPLPLSRVILHYRLGLPSLARIAAVRSLLRAVEAASAVLPRSLWSYFVLRATRP